MSYRKVLPRKTNIRLTNVLKFVLLVLVENEYKVKRSTMNITTKAISMAIKTQAKRAGVSNKQLAEAIGKSHDAFSRRINNRTTWQLDELDCMAPELGLSDGWALLDLARQEQRLSDNGLAA